MNLFLDTSALVKLYHREDGTNNLWTFLIQNSENLVLTISDLTRIEFRSAFLRRVRTKEIELDTTLKIFADLENDIELMNIVVIDQSIKERAIKLLEERASFENLRSLDSLQLASATISNASFPIDYFVAADLRLLEIAQEYFTVYNPLRESKERA